MSDSDTDFSNDCVSVGENDRCRDNLSVKSGQPFLKNIDKHFMSSPRMVVRGRYCGQDMELIVRRRPEGTYVDWALFNTKLRKQALLVHGEMNYPFKWSEDALRPVSYTHLTLPTKRIV